MHTHLCRSVSIQELDNKTKQNLVGESEMCVHLCGYLCNSKEDKKLIVLLFSECHAVYIVYVCMYMM